MSKFKERGYTLEDFGPNRVYITERVAETAIAASVLQIRPVKPEIERIRDLVNQEMIGSPEYQFPAEIDELNFVLRWGGKGNTVKFKIPFLGERGWDTKLHAANPSTRFLNGWNINVGELDSLRLGEIPLESKTLEELDPLKTVEVTIADWKNPRLTRQFTSGVLFSESRRRYRSPTANAVRDVFEAFDPQSHKRFEVVENIERRMGEQLDDLLPLAPLDLTDLSQD